MKNILINMYRNYGKRILDIIVSILVLVMMSPVLIITIIILLIENSGNPFFIQRRPGINQKPFNIYKLKTMADQRHNGIKIPDALRITPFGFWLRKLSIDELPQFINVLVGDMSIVGPRPLKFEYIPLYSIEQNKRHLVKPGITGWAQINGRNSLTWTRKFELDLYYVNEYSLKLDVIIMLKTILKVLSKENVNLTDEYPSIPFDGNN